MFQVGDQTNTRVGLAERVRQFFLIGRDPGRNAAMEGIRGYAALLVFLIHANGRFLFFHQGVSVSEMHHHSVVGVWH